MAGLFSSATLEQVRAASEDRKSTRLNSSHRCISYAVFWLKKKEFVKGHDVVQGLQAVVGVGDVHVKRKRGTGAVLSVLRRYTAGFDDTNGEKLSITVIVVI